MPISVKLLLILPQLSEGEKLFSSKRSIHTGDVNPFLQQRQVTSLFSSTRLVLHIQRPRPLWNIRSGKKYAVLFSIMTLKKNNRQFFVSFENDIFVAMSQVQLPDSISRLFDISWIPDHTFMRYRASLRSM